MAKERKLRFNCVAVYRDGDTSYKKSVVNGVVTDTNLYMDILLGTKDYVYNHGHSFIETADAGRYDKETDTRVFDNCIKHINYDGEYSN